MTAVKAHEVERALAARAPDVAVLLFYGPDAGRVAERARKAARDFVPDPDDALQLVRLDGDAVADEPGRLVEEATTFGLFGGRRAIHVRPTGRTLAGPVGACLDASLVDTLIVIEAGDLGRTAPLRVLCESSRRALALPCYADETRDLAVVVTDALRGHGLAIDRDARDLLVAQLGGDRLASRGEIEKLALYAHGQASVTVENIEAAVSDVSGRSTDAVLDAAFSGAQADLDDGLRRLRELGSGGGTLLALALRHGLALLAARTRLDENGGDVEAALRSWRTTPRRRDGLVRQVRRWPRARLEAAVAALQAATLRSRTTTSLADPVAGDTLLAIARVARALG